jgi:hypothetical protein
MAPWVPSARKNSLISFIESIRLSAGFVFCRLTVLENDKNDLQMQRRDFALLEEKAECSSSDFTYGGIGPV